MTSDAVATDAQLRRIGALANLIRKGEYELWRPDDARRGLIASAAGIDPPEDLVSTKTLTKVQASQAITRLAEWARTGVPDQVRALGELVRSDGPAPAGPAVKAKGPGKSGRGREVITLPLPDGGEK